MSVCEPVSPSGSVRRSLTAALREYEADHSERRGAARRSFDYRLCLIPLDGLQSIAEPIYVDGRDLSARGVGFEHAEPLTHRKVRLVAADPRLDELGFADLEIDVVLRWCRFLGTGSYESGGRVARSTVPLF